MATIRVTLLLALICILSSQWATSCWAWRFPGKVTQAPKPPAPPQDGSAIVFPGNEKEEITELPEVANTTNQEAFNTTTNSTWELIVRGNLPNCVDQGCPLPGYQCDQHTLTCREIVDDI